MFIIDRLKKRNKEHDKLKDSQSGTVFCVGMGPSLNLDDVLSLQGHSVFICNKIYLWDIDWSQYNATYFLADLVLYTENSKSIDEFVKGFKGSVVFDSILRTATGHLSNVVYVDQLGDRGVYLCQFSRDMSIGWYSGTTVMYRMLQYSAFSGFSRVVLLGIDFSYRYDDLNRITHDDMRIKDSVLISNSEENHFHVNYRRKGEKWSIPKLEIQLKHYKAARLNSLGRNFEIVNASRQTNLKVFKIVNLEDEV